MKDEEFKAMMALDLTKKEDAITFLQIGKNNVELDEQQFEAYLEKLMEA